MPTSDAPRSRSWDRTILISAAAVTLGVIALTAWMIWDAHRIRWVHAVQTSENLASALGHDIQHNIEIYDLSLRAVIQGLDLPDLANASANIRNHVLFDGAASAEGLGAILVLDEKGEVILDSRAPGARHADMSNVDYFKTNRDRPGLGLYLSPPSRSRTNGSWVMAISRRIDRPDGSFAGVAVGFLRLAYLEKLFKGVNLGAGGTVALFRSDGRVVMRTPFDEQNLGQDYSDAALFKEFAKAPVGNFEVTARLDGVHRLFVYQRLGNLPLVLSVGNATEAIFAEWQEKAIFTAAATFALLAMLAILATALWRTFLHAEHADAMLAEAIESISEGFVIYDANDRLVLCNEAYRALYPKNAPLMVPGTRFEDIVRAGLVGGQTPDAIGREEAWLAAMMDDHRRPSGPHEHRLWNGRWVLTSERRMPSGGIAGLRIDITALKEVQASLRASQAELIRAQRVSNTGSVVRDFRTEKTEWSDQTYRIFGVTREDFVPNTKTFLDLVHPDDRELVIDSIRASETGVTLSPLQYRIIRRDGETRWVYREAEVFFDDQGTPIGRVSTYQDVTEQQAAKLRQAELETQLRHSQKLEALGTLAGGIAHDLNNTLVPILALSKLGMKRLPVESIDYQDLEVIARASEQARDLVKQILAFSRKQEAEKHLVDIAVVVRESMQMLRASLPTTIRIIERIEPIPSILADGNQLHQVVTNLVTNAAQAIGDTIGTVTIVVRPAGPPGGPAFGSADAVCLSVADTGCGMEEAVVERVFEPFFTTKEVGQGSGLGLAVVHGIVVGHGGRIACRSKPGEGTEFTVTLPVAGGVASVGVMDPAA
jgi:PAS domain S-box-containing protein